MTNDIVCCTNTGVDVPIEIKKYNAPDWMQCSLKYDTINGKWVGSSKNRIPETAKKIFEEIIGGAHTRPLFNGHIPPFMHRDVTHTEWLQIKRDTADFADTYITCVDSTIGALYREKGCYYIQISDKGLYHLGQDICNFGVPLFTCEQQLRIRTKIHTRKNARGFCTLSVMVSCQPKNGKHITPSPYSLDNPATLPANLCYMPRAPHAPPVGSA